jgi:tetratricopeptide (TPR) repeat protein
MLALFVASCQVPQQCRTGPLVEVPLSSRDFDALPSAFAALSGAELASSWGQELKVARHFARDADFYRAITFYKRALFLLPEGEHPRRHEAEFGVVLAYYFGGKYREATRAFESSGLSGINSSFPAFEELLIILIDSYQRLGEEGKALRLQEVLDEASPEIGADLALYHAVSEGCLARAHSSARDVWHEELQELEARVCACRLNPKTAQTLQALLPGAGYWYVGHQQSALTSFLLNASFIAAAAHFIEDENWGAALFTISLEMGWYFGGIVGVGMAANEWNEHWYIDQSRPFLYDRKLSPTLLFEVSF